MIFKLCYWPILLSGWFLITFIISYTIAVAEENVDSFFPYISEIGVWQPSSCVFGQMMNIGALLTAISLYIRYQQIDAAIKTNTSNLNKKWNEIEFWLGVVVALGISLVANFQGDMTGYCGVLILHLLGALMAFGIGGVYLIIQTKITFDLQPYYNAYTHAAVSKSVQYFRLILVIAFIVSFFMVFGFSTPPNIDDSGGRIKWPQRGDTGYCSHLISVISEWILPIIFFLYILTMTNEFKSIKFNGISFEKLCTKSST